MLLFILSIIVNKIGMKIKIIIPIACTIKTQVCCEILSNNKNKMTMIKYKITRLFLITLIVTHPISIKVK